MRIKIIKPAMNRCVHSVIEVNDDLAADYIKRGIAIKHVEVRTKAIVSADTKQAKENADGLNERSGTLV